MLVLCIACVVLVLVGRLHLKTFVIAMSCMSAVMCIAPFFILLRYPPNNSYTGVPYKGIPYTGIPVRRLNP